MIRWYPDLAEEILESLCLQTRPSLVLFVEGAGYLPDWDIALMQTAYCLEPARLHPVCLIERVPYARPESFLERMIAAAQRGWLHDVNGEFGLTDAGREIVEGLYELGDRLFLKIKALTGSEMEHLLSLSDRVISIIKELPEPARKPAFELSLNFDRGVSTPLIVQVRWRLFVLLAFRDDAHITAWRPCEPDGQLWETFTLVWRGQAGSAAELAQKLPHRNYTESDYTAALERLTARDWITARADRFIAQEGAARMRQEVEDSTDRIFEAAFAGLSPAEISEFQELMRKFAAAFAPHENRG